MKPVTRWVLIAVVIAGGLMDILMEPITRQWDIFGGFFIGCGFMFIMIELIYRRWENEE